MRRSEPKTSVHSSKGYSVPRQVVPKVTNRHGVATTSF